jgi:hypothetical protein
MSTAKRHSSAGFYWLGVAMTLACLGLVLAGNTESFWTFEHSRFPLSWMFGGVAILAFLAAEFFHIPVSQPSDIEEEEESSQFAPEWEAIES